MNWCHHYHLPKVVPIVIFTIFFFLLLSLFLRGGSEVSITRRLEAKNDVIQLATAMAAFGAEYGYLPGTGRQVVNGELLAALMGSNTRINPRNICFTEVGIARRGRSGWTNGVYVDPWGGPYQVAFAEGTNSIVAGTNSERVNKNVAVWSDPSLSQDSKKSSAYRYVTSWD